MFFSSTTRRASKLFFGVFSIVFVVICFSSGFASTHSHHNKLDYKASLEEFIQQSNTGTTSTNNQLSKFTPLSQGSFDVDFDLPEAELAQAKSFFISSYERNLFYVHTTINAP